MSTLKEQGPAPRELYDSPHWYACHTRSRAEKQVERMLEDAGVEAYLPLIERERQWKDRTKTVAFPLFPSYVFARFRLGDIHQVIKVPGVSTILRPNGYATPVRDEEIDAVRHLVRGATVTGEEPQPIDYFTPGEEVVVISGPFKGMPGVLVEDRGKPAVAVRIGTLRQARSVQVARDAVRRVRAREVG